MPRGTFQDCNARAQEKRKCSMKQIIRELKRQVAGEKLEPEQLKGLIRGGYVYRNDDEHLVTDRGREALAQPGVYPGVAH
jgi:Txe/YoeB family toxin of Txe-Axe toxin-antitoxin module